MNLNRFLCSRLEKANDPESSGRGEARANAFEQPTQWCYDFLIANAPAAARATCQGQCRRLAATERRRQPKNQRGRTVTGPRKAEKGRRPLRVLGLARKGRRSSAVHSRYLNSRYGTHLYLQFKCEKKSYDKVIDSYYLSHANKNFFFIFYIYNYKSRLSMLYQRAWGNTFPKAKTKKKKRETDNF